MLPRITLFLAVLIFGLFAPRACCAAVLFPISLRAISESITRALNAHVAPINITENDIQLTVLPQARRATPVLILSALKTTGDRSVFWARLRCNPSTDCMSFVVLLNPPVLESENIRQELAKKPE